MLKGGRRRFLRKIGEELWSIRGAIEARIEGLSVVAKLKQGMVFGE